MTNDANDHESRLRRSFKQDLGADKCGAGRGSNTTGAAARNSRPTYDLEERIERIETLLACMVIHGDHLPSFDGGPYQARAILNEIKADLQEANDAEPC